MAMLLLPKITEGTVTAGDSLGLVIWQFDGVLLHFERKQRIGFYLSWKHAGICMRILIYFSNWLESFNVSLTGRKTKTSLPVNEVNIHYRHRFTSKTWELEKSNFRIFLTIQGFSVDCFCLVVPSRRELGLSPPVGSCLPHSLISHVSHCCQTWSLIRLSVINLFFNSNEWINIHLGNVIKSHRLILSRIFCFYR